MECEDQRLRKLHAVVETLVNHRKGNKLGTACSVAWPVTVKPSAVPDWRFPACGCPRRHVTEDMTVLPFCNGLSVSSS